MEKKSEKHCWACDTTKPVEQFARNKSKNDGLATECKQCVSRISKDRYKDNPTKKKNERLRRAFDITYDEYKVMLDEQGGVCAICKQPEMSMSYGKVKYLAIDHDHTTGEIRGLLCNNCNRCLGLLKDNIDTMYAMVEYIKQNKSKIKVEK